MLLLDYLKNLKTEHIVFEYGYYGIKGTFMKDDNLSVEGNAEKVLSFVETTGSLRFLYACSGECNDFEITTSENTVYLKYIDFR
ncbi:MAG: hypothetical protein Q4E53_12125 [Eubacteriales bacterium]|nr:hypothetical protein [Eubacteriales bacterium]